jgi:hypothetical protein
MRNSMTAVLERDGITGPAYTTEPYEAAWAGEARWFVRLLQKPQAVDRIDLTVQVSPDGLNWCDHEQGARSVDAPGVVTWVTREFGGWLRLRATVTGGAAGEAPETQVPCLIYLALKE